jgi:hypothetical protein
MKLFIRINDAMLHCLRPQVSQPIQTIEAMRILPALRLAALTCSACLFLSTDLPAQSFSYPPTPRQPVTETIWGKAVTDEYRWLEDMGSQQVKDWLQSQAAFTNSLPSKISGRDTLIEESIESWVIWPLPNTALTSGGK